MKRILMLTVVAIGGLLGASSDSNAHDRYGGGYGRGYGYGGGSYRSYGGGSCYSTYRPSYGAGYSGYSGYGYGVPVYSYPSYGYGGYGGYGYGVPVYGSAYQVYTPGFSIGIYR